MGSCASTVTSGLLQYQWTGTTQLTLKGDQKPPTQNSCRYGPDGQVQKTPIGRHRSRQGAAAWSRKSSRRKRRKWRATCNRPCGIAWQPIWGTGRRPQRSIQY